MELVITARRANRLEELTADIRGLGGECVFVAGDAADYATAKQCLALAMQKFGRVDVLVNNAGIGAISSFLTPAWKSLMRSCGLL